MFHYVWADGADRRIQYAVSDMCEIRAGKMNPFALLTLTYATATAFSAIMYFVLNRNGNLLHEYMKTNYVPFLFGIVLVTMEGGWVYAYKAIYVKSQSLKRSTYKCTVI